MSMTKSMNERELNKKLLRWRWPEATDFDVFDLANDPDMWVTFSDGVTASLRIPGIFTRSVDLCLDYLIPKLQELGKESIYIDFCSTKSGRWVSKAGYTDSIMEPYGVHELPARALCEAIVRLIERPVIETFISEALNE